MDISSVEQYIGYTVASQIMKEAFGDGMEYELIFQAVLEQMQNNNTSSVVSKGDTNTIISTSSSMSLDSLPLIRIGDKTPIYGKKSLTYNLSGLSDLGVTKSSSTNDILESYSYGNNEDAKMS